MASSIDEEAQHRRPHAQPMAAPYLEFNLEAELDQLHREPRWSSSGQNSKTLVKYDDLRIVLMALNAGARLPDHRTDGRLSIHVVDGHVQVRAEGRTFDLTRGSLLALDRGLTHDVEALDESAIVLTVAWPIAGGK